MATSFVSENGKGQLPVPVEHFAGVPVEHFAGCFWYFSMNLVGVVFRVAKLSFSQVALTFWNPFLRHGSAPSLLGLPCLGLGLPTVFI